MGDVRKFLPQLLFRKWEWKIQVKYKIVGSAEADPDEGRISDESPVGKALIGLKVGDMVSVQVPDGVVEYKVLGISI